MSRRRARATRKWEVFAGRNRFWCDGRLMTAPHPGVFLLTVALVAGTAALHLACDGPFLAARVSPALPAAGAAMAALTLAALLRTALSDPGILPRAAPHEAAPALPEARPPPRAREVLVRGTPVKLKYCFTCKLFRPPRASHCSLCDNCVERFDHHCPWVGNCVGRRNYRHFYTFVVSLAFLCVWVFACSVAHVALTARGAGLARALRQEPGSALVAAVCFLSVWSVLGLAGFHTYLAATDQTTNEDIKGSFSMRRGAGAGAGAATGSNPYSRGSACANCWHVLCGPLAPSLLDRRGPAPDPRDALPPALAPPPVLPLPVLLPPAPAHCPTPAAHRHAYMNHSLDLDSLPLQEVCVSGRRGGVSAGVGEEPALSASRLRLLLDTTMIDAALDLDDPESAPSGPCALSGPSATSGPPPRAALHAVQHL